MTEETVQAVLAMDREAGRLEDAAEEKRQTVSQTVERHRADLTTAYEQGVAVAVREMQEEQKKRLITEKALIDQRQIECLAAMAEKVEKQHDKWVQMLTEAALGE